MTKICNKCEIEKTIERFELTYCKNKSYRRKTCKDCRNLYHKTLYTRSGKGLRSYTLKVKYNLTIEEFELMLKNQNYRCYICDSTGTKTKWTVSNLAVDHCHKTNKVRKLLCDKCNKGLGQFNDDSELLKKAAIYITEHS